MKDSTSKVITILTVAVTSTTLFISFLMLSATYDNNKNTSDVLAGIEKLVDSNTKQIETLNRTIAVIEQQTVLNSYNSARTFTIDFQCTDNNKTDEDNNVIAYGYDLRPIVLTEDGKESPVSYRIFADLKFYGKESRAGSPERNAFAKHGLDSYLWDINNLSPAVLEDITSYLKQAEEDGFKFVHIAYDYDYHLVNPANDYQRFGNYQDGETIPMVLFQLHDNGKWHPEHFEEQYPCTS